MVFVRWSADLAGVVEQTLQVTLLILSYATFLLFDQNSKASRVYEFGAQINLEELRHCSIVNSSNLKIRGCDDLAICNVIVLIEICLFIATKARFNLNVLPGLFLSCAGIQTIELREAICNFWHMAIYWLV